MPCARRVWNSLCFIMVFIITVEIGCLPVGAQNSPGENILIFWTEKESLKAVTLVCVQGPYHPVGIVAIPVYIRLGQEGEPALTIAEAYGRLGRPGLTSRLEELFRVPIGSYLAVDQSTLEKASSIIGPLVMEGQSTSMVDIFEGSYTDGVIEPQLEIRHLAARLVEPQVIVKAPEIIWVFSTEVKTNLGCKNLWSIYRTVEKQGPEILKKKALTGRDYFVGNRKYRDVPPEAWSSILSEVTSA